MRNATKLLLGLVPRGVRLAGGGGFVGAYDAIPSIVAAYGMRRLRSAYTGNLLRLRRSSDNAEQDFGYLANGDLDAAAIASWLGGNSGLVTTWYDHSGNGYNATQSTAANQPLYVASGQNSKPIVRFDGSNDTLSVGTSNIGRNVGGVSIGIVYAASVPSATSSIVDIRSGAGGTRATVRQASSALAAGGRRLDGDTFQLYGLSSVIGAVQACSVILDYSNAEIRHAVNGVAGSNQAFQTSGLSSDTASTSASIGSSFGAALLTGDIAELVIANAAWTTQQRQAADAAANAYWGVY